MITRETVEEFFIDNANINDCNLTQDQVWGFYFLDIGKVNLKKLALYLKEKGYKIIDFFEAEMEADNLPKEYYLHVEIKEYHDIDSLDKRNQEFYSLAEKFSVGNYNGFDLTIN